MSEAYQLLSKKELKVSYLYLQELSTAEIAREMFVSVATIRQHKFRIKRKLNIDNNVQFVTKIKEIFTSPVSPASF